VLAGADVTTTTAPFRSILFGGRPEGAEGADPSVFADLNLDQVFAAVTAGRDEYDLMPFFSTPLHDLQTVEYRHQIPRDTEDGALRRGLAEFADRMRDMRKHLEQSAKLRYRYQKESWFLDAARMPTRYGEDLYQEVFGVADQQARV
jgi:DNA mismatch repair protein MutS